MTPQPQPIPNNSTPIIDLVHQDLEQRRQLGIRKYGTVLQAFNGRNPLWDAYEEVLDLALYLRQAIEEQDVVRNENRADSA